MSGSRESWRRGRSFETKMKMLLPNYFDEVECLFDKKTKRQRNFDFKAVDKDGRKVYIECKSRQYPNSNISLNEKDLCADYLFLNHGSKVHILSKQGELYLRESNQLNIKEKKK